MLKEYWDTVARSHERLTQNKGVKSVSVFNKTNKSNNHKQKLDWKLKIIYHLSRGSKLNKEGFNMGHYWYMLTRSKIIVVSK